MSTNESTQARAAVLRTIGGPFQIESIEVSAPREHEVLVRMVGVGICHTDLVCRDGFGLPMPIVLGHEGSGIVEAVGSRVTRLRRGDPVVISFDSCGGLVSGLLRGVSGEMGVIFQLKAIGTAFEAFEVHPPTARLLDLAHERLEISGRSFSEGLERRHSLRAHLRRQRHHASAGF